MRVAFIVLAHSNLDDVAVLLECLSSAGQDTFLHVDKDVEIAEPTRTRLKTLARLVERRVSVKWGDFSMVEAEKSALFEALDQSEADHFILLSGSCFPVRPFRELADKLKRERAEYIDIETEAESASRPRHARLASYRFASKRMPALMLRALNRASRSLIVRQPFEQRFGQPRFGSMWWALSRDFATWARTYTTQRPDYDRRFRFTEIPDECYFQTLVSLSPFARNVQPTLSYTDWSAGGLHPKHLSRDDLDNIAKSDCFFARKFRIGDDPDLMRDLANAWRS